MALGPGIAIFVHGFLFVAQRVRHPMFPTCTCRSSAGLVPLNAWLTSCFFFFFLRSASPYLHPFCPRRQMFSLSSCSGHLSQPSTRWAKLLCRHRSRFVRDWGVIFICQTFIPMRDAFLATVVAFITHKQKKITLTTCTNETEKKKGTKGEKNPFEFCVQSYKQLRWTSSSVEFSHKLLCSWPHTKAMFQLSGLKLVWTSEPG